MTTPAIPDTVHAWAGRRLNRSRIRAALRILAREVCA
jgi:hypothetical protein